MAGLPLIPTAPRHPRRRRPAAPPVAPPPVAGAQPDLFAGATTDRPHALTYLDITALGLAVVPVHALRPDDGPDGYLYHITTAAGLDMLRARGTLLFSPRAPLVLTERPGVLPWLANMMEVMESDSEAGHRSDSPVVFRVKRFVIDRLLEHDPDQTREYGVSFFLLTGLARQE
ncbi:hypothetical protein B0W47_09365 [Komagataeibacter nataicola]|uniref:Uncharacterized protein n=1 Tax=Komagataeibacter nataicola TaxID=265960 RepID=A0A9N7CBY1_9PROT|nr:hypothetical protein [Komagataeibacter nataicola]AQU88991.1 hypothetical protein B0W47_09365 [Komagataeibacter nataicola]PYD66985.1 hypothetical protein CDI09_04790 [Komagataeibacter nataicola]WEQ55386.1 hypothetical protein LV564_15075 [Komagataeibacter nataicola]